MSLFSAFNMGNADSKPVRDEVSSTVLTANAASKGAGITSYDGHDEGRGNKNDIGDGDNNSAGFVEEKKENAITPRMKTRRKEDQARDDDDDDHAVSSAHIHDDQVHVNLAMADLMAYLQVVANNSNQLPLTRRDDPELDRTISALTSEDYARKSAAFIPSDVRVIGGTFTRYGRVWDLPTSEEYNAVDGAHEPGRSYGGACCNALLKVLYDAANDATDAAQNEAASAALFDDDDDDDEDAWMGKSFKSGYSLETMHPNPTTISWSELLRKMKAEIKDIEYAQIPKITTSRKFDLSRPFSLAPVDFDSKTGKKRSLLIGCNYKNITDAELKASHDDVRSMKDYIVNVHGFPETKGLMTVLLDDNDHKHPTFLNITEAFKALSEESQPGDAVFVQFSGHGGRVLDAPVDDEAESYDEVIVPCDYKVSGLIRDTLIFKTLLAPMRYGVTVTILIDTCDTGMVMELPYSWTAKSLKKEPVAKLTTNDDFSFVRFLKVVKTLYESSTFTQLGRTVGSALMPSLVKAHDDEDAVVVESIDAYDDLKKERSVLETIVRACTSGKERNHRNGGKNSRSAKNGSKRDEPSLLEQVINCTLLSHNDDDYSDEETLQTRTEDDHSFEEAFTDGGEESVNSYDSKSHTEDEIESRRARRSKRR